MSYPMTIIRLFVLVVLLGLNGRGNVPSLDEHGNTSEQVLALAKFRPQLTNLATEYKMALKSSEGASQFQAAIMKAMANIDAAGKPVTTNGNNLPAAFTDVFYPQGPYGGGPDSRNVDYRHVGLMGLGLDNYVDQVTLNWAGKLIISAPDILIPVLQKRAKVLPPTAADYILFPQMSDAITGELDEDDHNRRVGAPTKSNTVPLSSTAGLLTLAQAKNPIYRLLLVDMGGVLIFESYPSEADKFKLETKILNLCSAYLNETDPIILGGVIEELAGSKIPAAITLLQSFQPAVQKTRDTKLEARLQYQIQRLQK